MLLLLLDFETYIYVHLRIGTHVDIYANMAAMLGVRQIDDSCPIFYRIYQTYFRNYKCYFQENQLDQRRFDFIYLFSNVRLFIT